MNFARGLTRLQLIELDSCVKCGECVKWCPVVTAKKDVKLSPVSKITEYRNLIKSFSKKPMLSELAESIFNCTTCGRCYEVCPVGIRCHELWPVIRHNLVEMGFGPVDKIDELRETLKEFHNPFGLPYEDRNKWMEEEFEREAEVAIFVGCELAYRIKDMATGMVKILQASGMDFAICPDEWCCGFPLYILGDRSEVLEREILHNVEMLKKMGVKKVVPYCPCCYAIMKRVWKNYAEIPFEIVHIFEIVSELIKDGRLKFTKRFDGKVSYHDPCYLSRGWEYGKRIIEEPRSILKAIDGLEIVELPENKKLSRCPGSGGGLRRSNPELSEKMALKFMDMVADMDIDYLLTGCPAVKERLTFASEKVEVNFKIMDLLDFASMFL